MSGLEEKAEETEVKENKWSEGKGKMPIMSFLLSRTKQIKLTSNLGKSSLYSRANKYYMVKYVEYLLIGVALKTSE